MSSVFEWLQEQAQLVVNYLIDLRNDVAADFIAGILATAFLAVGGWLLVRLGLRRRKQEPQHFDEAFLYQRRQAMLDAVERQWIQGPLERSLHNQAPLFLGISELPEAVERPWEYDIQTPAQTCRTRDTSAILDVFDDCGSLLILGTPGSGKTVTLLDLARQLIERARRDENAPLPVVFVLAFWAQQKKPLDEWMIAEMQRQYRVPPPLGRHWTSQHELLPLFDGLDEMEESARDGCVEAINAYRDKAVGGAPLVVCSRQDEYSRLSTRLEAEVAISLQPLSLQQIEQYISRFGEQSMLLTRMLAENGALRELARTPLWLDVMAVAYGGTSTATAPEVMAPADIFDAYIRRVLLEHRQPLQEWSPGQSMHWLRWLAQQLERTEQQVFRLEEMQPNWLGEDAEQRQYYRWLRLVGGVLYGLVGWLLGWLVFRLGNALVYGLVFGLLGWLVVGRGGEREGRFIRAVTGLVWDWREARTGLVIGLASWLVGWLVFWLVGEPVGELVVGLVFGLFGALTGGLVFGLLPVREIGLETRPNQEIWQSATMGLVFGLVLGLAGGLVFGLGFGQVVGLRFGLFVGLLGWLISPGGKATVRHVVLRWRLWREGLTPKPWRYVSFLEAMTEHMLLDRIGGAYKFKHDLLQKHVAQLGDGFIVELDQEAGRGRAAQQPNKARVI